MKRLPSGRFVKHMRQDFRKNFNYVKVRRVSNPRYIILAISSAKDA